MTEPPLIASSDDTLERLDRLARTQPGYTHGSFRFSFGKLDYVDPVSLRILYEEVFVRKVYDFRTDAPAPVIVDCGGNIGFTVLRFKQLYPESRVTVYEADPAICRVLKENVRTLGLVGVEVVCAGVWCEDGEMDFVAEGGDGGRLVEGGNARVRTIRLADRLKDPVDLLKLDIEGAEWEVLADLCDSGALDRVSHLIVEFHGRRNHRYTFGRLLSQIAEAGFDFTFPWSYCEPGLPGDREPTPFPYAKDGKYICFFQAWRPLVSRSGATLHALNESVRSEPSHHAGNEASVQRRSHVR